MVTKQKFPMPNGEVLTVLIMDDDDFEKFCDSIARLDLYEIHSKGPATDQVIEKIRHEKHLPLMANGRKTNAIFEKYEVDTQFLAAIVRGHGVEVMNRHLARIAEMN